MIRRVITIRPEPGCSATAAAGGELGLAIACHPLFAAEPIGWSLPPGHFDGVLVGSANAVRHGGPLVDKLVDIPVYAVGEATAAAAAERGLRAAAIGRGGLQAVVDTLGGQTVRLLRLSGSERVALDPPQGVEIVEVVTYRVAARPLAPDLMAGLADEPVVLLHSAAAARHLRAECERLSLARDRIRLAALGPRIAAAAGGGWGMVASACEPNDRALLALARELCHEPFVG